MVDHPLPATDVPTALRSVLPDALLVHCSLTHRLKGERLFLTGAKPVSMFYVSLGEVVLERLGRQGEWLVLQRTRAGFVAEASLQSTRYHCDARVLVDAEVTRVEIAPLREALVRDAAFAARWIGMLNLELRRLRLQCERLSLNRVQDRLLHLIETEGQGGRLPLGAGLKSLAGQLGVTHEALYRCVASLEKSQDLKREGSELVLMQRGEAQ
jgi:CRP-like cAMP-binding protein